MSIRARLRQGLAVGSIESFGVIVGGIAGLLIVNLMPKDQYAQYTFLVACSSLMLGISDLGLAHCAMPIVGRRAGEVHWVVGACHQIFRWRWLLLGAGLLFVGPYWWGTARKHGWEGLTWWLATAVTLGTLLMSLREHFTNTVVLLMGQVATITRIAMVSYAVRIPLIALALLLPLQAWTLPAIMIATGAAGLVSVLLYQRALRRAQWGDQRLDAAGRQQVNREVLRISRPLVLPAVFYQFQSVITVFLVTLFGSSDLLADVGAFGRLAMVLVVVDRVTGMLLFPALARAPAGPRLAMITLRVHAVYLGMMAMVLLSAWLGAHWWILLLGEKYRNMEPYVAMIFLVSILSNAAGFTFRTLTSRGLTANQSYGIPLTIGMQVAYLWLIGVHDLPTVLGFGIVTGLANFGYQYALLALRWSDLRQAAVPDDQARR